MSDPYTWPENENSPKVAQSLDWTSVPYEVMQRVDQKRVRSIPVPQLKQLHSRYLELFEMMPKPSQEVALAILEGRPPVAKKPVEKAGRKEPQKSDKERLLEAISDIEQLGADDPGLLLKAVETRAKLLALLNVKPESVDQTVNIYVNTGVVRE